MKHDATSTPSISPEQRAAALAAAPEHATDPNTPYEAGDPGAVDAHWQGAIASRGLPELRETLATRRRGPGRVARKVSTTIRFDADVLAAMKATGPGWQTRINDAVRDWIKAHPAA